MTSKKKILIIFSITTILVGLYYFTSPYQNCLRKVEKRIEEVRNKMATETDLSLREKLELDQAAIFNQREFGGLEMTNW